MGARAPSGHYSTAIPFCATKFFFWGYFPSNLPAATGRFPLLLFSFHEYSYSTFLYE
jgi:hypothetical protein